MFIGKKKDTALFYVVSLFKFLALPINIDVLLHIPHPLFW